MTVVRKSTHENGYSAVLCRSETKDRLQHFRRSLPNRDLNQERRLVTACIEYCLADATAHNKVLAMVQKIVLAEIDAARVSSKVAKED